MKYTLLHIGIFLFISPSLAKAQLFKKLKNRVQDKIEKRVEDKVVEEVSEEIARRAMRPIDEAIDNLFKEAYKEEYGKDYDESQEMSPEDRNAMLSNVFKSVYGSADLPESYTFDYALNIDIYDYGDKKAQRVTMKFAKDGGYFGMVNSEDKKMTMVMDVANDHVAMFNESEKSVFTMGGVMTMAKSLAASNMEELNYDIDKSGKSKKVAGYACKGYSFTTSEDEGEFYMTNALPFNWEQYFKNIFDEMYGDYYDNTLEGSGMLMYSESKRKSDSKKSKWEVKKVDEKKDVIICGDYKSGLPSGQ